jgi:hypothetical protein
VNENAGVFYESVLVTMGQILRRRQKLPPWIGSDALESPSLRTARMMPS